MSLNHIHENIVRSKDEGGGSQNGKKHMHEKTSRKRMRVRGPSPAFLYRDCSAHDSSVKSFRSEADVATKKRIGSRIDVRIGVECAAGLADYWKQTAQRTTPFWKRFRVKRI